jgi:hypothetical protein
LLHPPGRPVENGFIESLNGRLRDECLNVEWLNSLGEAREGLDRWRRLYNQVRSHSALGDRSPAYFAAAYAAVAERFALIRVDTASGGPRQWFAAPAKNAALDPVPACQKIANIRAKRFSKTLILETRY